MERLSFVFQLSVYSLACLSSAMLALAEGSWLPTSLGVALTLLALYLTEVRRTIRLRSTAANALGVIAVLAASAELFSDNIEARLLSGAHLLAYLLWIVLFQDKSIRQYWWMLALCVLQVAVASVLTADGWFGGMLVLFFFGAIWTLSVFTLYRSQQRFDSDSISPDTDGADPRRAASDRMPLPGPRFLRGPGSVRGSIQSDSPERWLSLRFAIGTIGWAWLAILVAAVFFTMIPRLWIGQSTVAAERDGGGLGRPTTGFTEEVRLGDFGRILESTEKAFEIRLFDDASDEPLDVEQYTAQLGYDEPLFRGAVLGRYRDGHWLVDESRFGPPYMRADRRTRRGMVRQEFRMQPIGTGYLFAIHPVRSCRLRGSTSVVRLHPLTSTLSLHDGEAPRGEVEYRVWSPRETDGQPAVEDWQGGFRYFKSFVRSRYLELPDGLPRLAELSSRLAGDGPDTALEEKAERLVAFLRDSGEYGYSLDASIQNSRIDPIEDFLFHRKQGHCEYFASALTLMLRSVGVPARLVSGFKGGALNRFSGAFEVEQRHAHAWVEALIDDRWVVLDPTPSAARSESVTSLGPRVSTWSEFTSLMSGAWSRHVVGMNFANQRSQLYRPLEDTVRHWWNVIREGRVPTSSLWSNLKRLLTSPDRWFSWQGGVVTFVLLLVLSGLVWLMRRLWKLARRLTRRFQRLDALKRGEVEFYERFRRICESQGLYRGAAQTQREFAATVSARLNALLAAAGLAEFPERLIESFYRIRFGAEKIDSRLAAEIDERLAELERSLEQPRPTTA